MDLNLWDVFSSVAAAVPDRECIVWRDRRLTYADVADRSRRLASVLAGAGLGCSVERDGLEGWEAGQDLVGLYLLNGPEYLEASLAGYGARTAPFNVNYRYVADELAYLLDDAGAAGLVFHARFAPTLREVLPRLKEAPRVLLQVADDSGEALLDGALDYEAALAGAGPFEVAGHSPDDLYVLYTGGTTGMPKGTLWRQADIWGAVLGALHGDADVDGVVANAVAGGNRLVPDAPFMHGAAHWLAMQQVLGGGCVVVNDVVDRLDPAEVWSTVERERGEVVLVVGEAFARPLVAALERGTYDTSSVKVIVAGGAVTSPESKSRLLQLIPQALLLDAAGASETGSGLSNISMAGMTAEAGVFDAIPGVVVLDEALQRQLEPGEDAVGWYAKSGRIPLGYLGDQAKTERTFPVVGGVRWSVPGDRARWRADGKIELLGRDSVTINTGGEKVFAEEVEAAVLTCPGVRDAVVVGRPSDQWGQEVVAVVSVEDGAEVTDQQILDAAAQRIARYKLPKAIIRVDTVLRSPAGKADYRWAKDRATA